MLDIRTEISEEAQVVYSGPRGVVCLVGALDPVAENVAFTAREQREVEQRRNAYRVTFERPARIRRADGEVLAVRTGDISAGGALVLADQTVPVDEEVTLIVALAQEPVELPGRVVRADDQGYSIEFGPLPRPVDNLLSRVITDAQRRRVRI